MFAGHFALASGVKAKTPQVPLWALMLSTQLLDVLFVPLLLTGVETIVPVGHGGYGEAVIHADYTHSLTSALLISLIFGFLAARLWGRKGGVIIGSVVFSHWILDLFVHRIDLPIFPANIGNFPLLGLGLWRYPVISILLEGLLVMVGLILYIRSIVPGTSGKTRVMAIISASVMGTLLSLSLLSSILGWA
ncbi:permease [Sporolactobacillus laevolacticus]|uniref:permease n=1 Tax=Sporolactobacillus laevolacticus TaxID=33018 RepID=UPI0025B51D44|nr:permease [Sporolactobacillus laevolacticus]MDN3956390.1 permease [Sporolactobacillus laevolacticus]